MTTDDRDGDAFAKAADPNIEPWHLPGMGCAGSCSQGRQPCPHPKQCEQLDGVPVRELLLPLLWPIGLIAGCALTVALWRSWPWW